MPANILVADDDEAMLGVYARLFSGTGYAVSLAASFAEAAWLVAANDYDLLITDLLLGDGLGTDLIRLFEKKRAGARSLLVTGSMHGVAAERLPAACFAKPLDVDAFMAAVARALA
ncbi:MAG: response regulator [Elusimicrobia bacterium]|nr:response regulator [Elusimicrobiota bacterium]